MRIEDIHLGQRVRTPEGVGTVVELRLGTNGLYVEVDQPTVIVWFGVNNPHEGPFWQRVYYDVSAFEALKDG